MASFLFSQLGKLPGRAGHALAVYRFPVGSGMGLTGIVKGVPRYTPRPGLSCTVRERPAYAADTGLSAG